MLNNRVTEKDVTKKFGERMKQLRKKKELSQEKLALDIEMDLTSVNEIENGHRSPKLITMYKIAQALGVSLSELTDI
jgi:transcriptional regulator with XRE-family HTH domain